MKKYLVFRGYDYHPAGGWEDFKEAFDSLDEAKNVADFEAQSYEWSHIVDTETMKRVD